MKLKAILDSLIAEKGVSVAELSRATGISRQSITNILKGSTQYVHRNTAKRLADYFGVSPSYLLTGEDKKDEPPLAARVEALEREIKVSRAPLTPERRRELKERYVFRGLLAFRLEPGTKIDAAGWDKIYKLLDELDREFAEEDDAKGGGPEP